VTAIKKVAAMDGCGYGCLWLRMFVATDGCGYGWLWLRMVVAKDGFGCRLLQP